jgi:cbb3-type cytochrome oxidase maturation protein
VSIILVLIPLSILIAIGFLAAFIWAVRSGQFEDTCTPSMRVLMEETAAWKTTPPATLREATNPAPPLPAENSIEAQTMAISEKAGIAPEC